MSWWPGWIGGAVGYALGGPLGALIGLVVGQYIEKQATTSTESFNIDSQARAQAAFFTATFSVMGHIAKSDGVVTRDEIRFSENLMAQMQLSDEQRRAAISLYRQGKNASFRLDAVLDQFRYVCQRDAGLLRMYIEIQMQAACADRQLHPAQRRILLQVCDRLGFSRAEFDRMIGMAGVGDRYSRKTPANRGSDISLEQAYAILNIDRNAGAEEVKTAYRRQLSRHHPDKLIAKGLPEEMVQLANEKTRELRAAYDRVSAKRSP